PGIDADSGEFLTLEGVDPAGKHPLRYQRDAGLQDADHMRPDLRPDVHQSSSASTRATAQSSLSGWLSRTTQDASRHSIRSPRRMFGASLRRYPNVVCRSDIVASMP